MIVGLTGSIATGKSEVARLLRERGIPVFDADTAVHELYSDPSVAAAIAQLFPNSVAGGQIDRKRLSVEIAGRRQSLERLEALVHPLVREKRNAFLARWKTADIVVCDIPLLFETGADADVDVTLVISTTPELQRTRALARPGMSVDKLDFILSRQMPMEEKAARADFVIDNSRDLEHLALEVDMLIQHLRRRARESQT